MSFPSIHYFLLGESPLGSITLTHQSSDLAKGRYLISFYFHFQFIHSFVHSFVTIHYPSPMHYIGEMERGMVTKGRDMRDRL